MLLIVSSFVADLGDSVFVLSILFDCLSSRVLFLGFVSMCVFASSGIIVSSLFHSVSSGPSDSIVESLGVKMCKLCLSLFDLLMCGSYCSVLSSSSFLLNSLSSYSRSPGMISACILSFLSLIISFLSLIALFGFSITIVELPDGVQ